MKYALGTNTFGLSAELAQDRVSVYKKLKEIGYTYLEPTIFCDADVKKMKERLSFGGSIWASGEAGTMLQECRAYGMDVSSFFVQYLPFTEIDSLAEVIFRVAAETGIRNYVSAPRLSTIEEVDQAAENYNRIAQLLQKEGLTYYYHNHDRDFVRVKAAGKEQYLLDRFIERTDPMVKLELDIGWMEMCNVNPAAYIEKHLDRTGLVHLNDLRHDRLPEERHSGWCAFGEGVIDSAAVLAAVKRLSLSGNVILIDQEWAKDNMLDEMGRCAQYIRKELYCKS